MNLELVLINQETGEPIYHAVMTTLEVLQSSISPLTEHAVLMTRALESYKPKAIPPRAIQAQDVGGQGDFGLDDDLLGGSTNMGY